MSRTRYIENKLVAKGGYCINDGYQCVRVKLRAMEFRITMPLFLNVICTNHVNSLF